MEQPAGVMAHTRTSPLGADWNVTGESPRSPKDEHSKMGPFLAPQGLSRRDAENSVPPPGWSSGRNRRCPGRGRSIPPSVTGRTRHDRVCRSPPPSLSRLPGCTPPGFHCAGGFGRRRGCRPRPQPAVRRRSIQPASTQRYGPSWLNSGKAGRESITPGRNGTFVNPRRAE
jgi:hypothetical protein